jgi:xanthine/CO dehydrogenase XdhC/CoxF family maturation factor
MKEQKAIVEAFRKVDLNKRKAALATVVKVRGSSYRSPGARMLITDDGHWTGSISGGCLEGDALRKARQVMTEQKPITVTYDTSEESNQNLGIGLGCNGIIDVLIEPVNGADENNPIQLFEKILSTREPLVQATIFTGSMNAQKLLMTSEGILISRFADSGLTKLVAEDLKRLFETHKSEASVYEWHERSVEMLTELIQPSVTLMIFGGGFDARPVSQLAKSLGWDVEVTDECVAHIAPVFFPTADKLTLCHRDFIDRDFNITPYTACVLMSHNYEYDRDVLRKILRSDTPYIGILGPRKRFDKMLKEFEKEGTRLTESDLHRIHSPIGLDIGAETPDEIALSITAEIQARFANRQGGFLKHRNAPIHLRDAKSDQVFREIYVAPASSSKSASRS